MFHRARFAAALAVITIGGAACMDREGLQMAPDGGSTGAGGRVTGTGGVPEWGVGGAMTGAGGARSGAGGTVTGRDAGPDADTRDGGTVIDGGFMCGPVCAIYCRWGNVLDSKGCPTCSCNPPPACSTQECGPPPPLPICTDGSAPPLACSRNDDGTCSWKAGMCSKVCPPIACTTMVCPYGYRTDSSGCQICECNPAPPACTTEQCGPAPRTPTMMCSDGSTAGPVCGLNADGKCGWTITTCPPIKCTPVLCLVACPYGSRKDVNGCDTCDCLPAGDCGASRDSASCEADTRCRWLVPGCGTPALAVEGCYARADIGCTGDSACTGGRTCLKRNVNPCPAGAVCDACGSYLAICL